MTGRHAINEWRLPREKQGAAARDVDQLPPIDAFDPEEQPG